MLNSKWDLMRYAFVILAINIALTAWTVYVKPVLNYDAILYITAAQAIKNENWQLAAELYQGSFYPFLIQLVSKLSGLSLEISAHGINSLCLTLISLAFIAIVQKLGGDNKKTLLIATLVILFFPSLLKFRPMIIRDFAYLSCYLWSVYFLLSFYQNNKTTHLTLWAALLCLGACFRIESVIFLVTFFAILAFSFAIKKVRNGDSLLVSSLAIASVIAVGLLLALPTMITETANTNLLIRSISYPSEYINRAITVFGNKLASSSNESGGIIMAIINPVGSVIHETLKRLEIIYAILAVIAFKMRLVLIESYQRKVIAGYIALNIIILSLFEISLGYLTSRYTLALTLTILVLAPFALAKATDGFFEKKHISKIGLSLLIIALCFISLKRLSVSERHIESTTGNWVQANIANDQKIVSNNSKILYYANQYPYFHSTILKRHFRFSTGYLLNKRNKQNKENFDNADYLVFLINEKDSFDLEKDLQFKQKYGEPIKRLEQHERLYVHIYKTNN